MSEFIDSREAVSRIWHGRRLGREALRHIGTAFRLLIFCLTAAGGFWLCAGVSLANSPARARSVVITPRNIPEGTRFLDLLIPMSKDDPYYCSFNQSMGEATGLTGTAPIAGYTDEDGYISYSFHMEGAVSDMLLEETIYSYAFGEGAYAGGQTHLEYIQQNFGTIKVALLDGAGEILAVSDEASIKTGRSGYLAGTIAYDCSMGRLSPSIYKGNGIGMLPAATIVVLLSSAALAVRAVFTAAVESVVSLVFRIRPWTTVFVVNMISNMIFNLLLIMGTAMLQIPYLSFVTAGEIIVVWAEYSVYRRRLVSGSRSRVLGFTITANLISLILGILLGYLLPGRALL